MVKSLLPVRAFPLFPYPSGGNPAALPGGIADAWRIVQTAERLGAVVRAAPPNVGGALWHPWPSVGTTLFLNLPPELTLRPQCLEHTTFTLQPGQIDASGLVPTIVGVAHTHKRTAFHRGLLADAYTRGVRRVGFEATPFLLSTPDLISEFEPVIRLANNLGMEVVPLESQATYDYRSVIDLAYESLTEDGTLAIRSDLLSVFMAACCRELLKPEHHLPYCAMSRETAEQILHETIRHSMIP